MDFFALNWDFRVPPLTAVATQLVHEDVCNQADVAIQACLEADYY